MNSRELAEDLGVEEDEFLELLETFHRDQHVRSEQVLVRH